MVRPRITSSQGMLIMIMVKLHLTNYQEMLTIQMAKLHLISFLIICITQTAIQHSTMLSGNAYHSNGKTAFNKLTGKFYDENGKNVNKTSLSFGFGAGFTLKVIPKFSISVYGRTISK